MGSARMIRLTNLADYAVVVMTAAAKAPMLRFTAPEIALQTGIPAPTVAKLMGTLARAGLLRASRGVGGGFELQRALGNVSIAAIIEAVEGPIALTQCLHGGESARSHECAIEGSCSVRGHWTPINRAVRAALDAVTLADLVKPAVAKLVAATPAATAPLAPAAANGELVA